MNIRSKRKIPHSLKYFIVFRKKKASSAQKFSHLESDMYIMKFFNSYW